MWKDDLVFQARPGRSSLILPPSSFQGQLVGLGPRRLDHLAPDRVLRPDVVAEFGGRPRRGLLGERVEALLDVGLGERPGDPGVEPRYSVRRRARGRDDAIPFARFTQV